MSSIGERKLQTYIDNKELKNQFDTCYIDGVKRMVGLLDLTKDDDVEYLAYVMWENIPEFELIINENLIIDLEWFEQKIKQCTPKVTITSYGKNPLNGPRARFDGALAYYDCVKFVGQFTHSQQVYDLCLRILQAMPVKLDGPILNPPDVMYLMNFNKHVQVQHCPKIKMMDNQYDFNHSIYQPSPMNDDLYERYKKQMQLAYYKIAQNDSVGYICLALFLMKTCYYNVSSANYTHRLIVTLNNKEAQIMNDIFDDVNQCDECVVPNKMEEEINEKLYFITPDAERDINHMFIDAYIYVTDDCIDFEQYQMKKQLFYALYEKGIVPMDSKLTHNLLRNAVDLGVLWIVKFLIDRGCKVKDLPCYAAYEWQLESMQLIDILHKKATDNTKTMAKKNVHDYLVRNNLI